MKQLSVFLCFVLVTLSTQAQSPVGKWKYSAMYTETGGGKKTDLLKDLFEDKENGCAKDIVFAFSADGKISVDRYTCPDKDKVKIPGIGWKSSAKNKITMYFEKDADTDPQTYNLEFIGNKMRWTMDFSEPKDKGKSDLIKLLVIEYVKA